MGMGPKKGYPNLIRWLIHTKLHGTIGLQLDPSQYWGLWQTIGWGDPIDFDKGTAHSTSTATAKPAKPQASPQPGRNRWDLCHKDIEQELEAMDIHPPNNNGKTWQRENYGETSSILPTKYGSIIVLSVWFFLGLSKPGKPWKTLRKHPKTTRSDMVNPGDWLTNLDPQGTN